MQATVHTFDETTGSGTVLTDNGRLLTVDPSTFAASRLRHLRLGQRVSIEVDGAGVSRLWIEGIGPGQRIR
jgi:cold shock CspA family protein